MGIVSMVFMITGNSTLQLSSRATMLHLLCLHFRELVYPRSGLNERLTDQYPARVVQEILA